MSETPKADRDPTQADNARKESGSLWRENGSEGEGVLKTNHTPQTDSSQTDSSQTDSNQADGNASRGALFNEMLGRARDESQKASDAPVSGNQAKTEAEPIIRLVNVSKAFGSHKVLEDISLSFYPGKTTVILGPSGTGKSVLLKIICGLLKPDSGEVWFRDQRVDELSERELVGIRKKMGMLFQMGALFDSMTVGENVAFPLLEHHRKMSASQRHERCLQMLKVVGLKGVENKMPSDLSGGQKKRVALARAIILEPELVMYDEPTTGLDPIRSDVINELILGLTRQLGLASIAVTHDMISADKIADRMVMLYDGKVVIDGSPQAFHRSENDLVNRFIRGQADEQELAAIREGIEPVVRHEDQ